MKSFRILCLALAIILCMSLFSACNEPIDGESSDPVSSESSEQPYGPVELGFKYGDQSYFGSEPIRILTVETARDLYGEQQFTYIEENTESKINTAVKKRNDYLEKTYGITFEVVSAKYPVEELQRNASTDSNDYDLVCDSVDRLVHGISEKLFRSLDDHMNFMHAWWAPSSIDDLAIGEKHYLLVGDALLTDEEHTYLTFINKDMYNSSGLYEEYGNIYDIVFNGGFTIDLYYEMAKTVAKPAEEGESNDQAIYGSISSPHSPYVFMNGLGVKTASKDENGNLKFNIADPYSLAAFDKVYALLSDYAAVYTPALFSASEFINGEKMFFEGRSLFYQSTAGSIIRAKNSVEFDIGVLPIPQYGNPKYDKNNYSGAVDNYYSSALAVTASVPDEQMPQVVFALQALGYYSMEVNRAFYEDITGSELTASENRDFEMLDIVFYYRTYDIGTIYRWGGLLSIYPLVIANTEKNELETIWGNYKQVCEAAMNDAIRKYNSLE